MPKVSVTIRFGGGNELTRSVDQGTSLGSLVQNRDIKAALGYGDNINVLISRRHIDDPASYRVGEDVTVDIETAAARKAAENEVTVRFGGGNSITKRVPEGSTIGDVVGRRDIKVALGYGDNIKVMIDRVEQDMDDVVTQGDTLDIETAAATKAA